jgi:hypothetical protein
VARYLYDSGGGIVTNRAAYFRAALAELRSLLLLCWILAALGWMGWLIGGRL